MAPPASSNRPAYEWNEKVLCFHHELLYEAKIMDDPQREDENDSMSAWKFLVHYKGWKNTWDDWVPQDRLRKLTEDNRELAASLRRDVMQAESRQRHSKSGTTSKKGRTQGSEIGSGRGSEERNSSVPAGGRGAKRGKDNEIEKVATPEFPTPRRSSRLQSIGFSQSTLSTSPDPVPSGSGQDDEDQDAEAEDNKAKDDEAEDDEDPSAEAQDDEDQDNEAEDDEDDEAEDEAEATTLPTDFNFGPPVAFKSNKGRALNLQPPLGGRAGVPNRSIKTMASRRIHGWYDVDGNYIPNKTMVTSRSDRPKPEVLSRRGYFKDGKYYSPDLETAGNGQSQAEPRPSRRSGRSVYLSEQPPLLPDAEPVDPDMMYDAIMNLLRKPPPPDEPEHMSVETFNTGHYWAPLIGGTTQSERAQIEEEAQEMGWWTPIRPQVHPEYAKTRINDPLNAAKLLFYEHQDPDRVMMIAGIPKDPTHVDLPGSGTCFDALKFPDRLVEFPAHVLGNLSVTDLQQLDRATIMRFPNVALRMISPKFLAKMKIPVPAEHEPDNNIAHFQEENFFARPSVHIPVPDIIKGYLVDDWENVTKNLELVALPSKAPVNWVLDTYFHEEKGKRRLGSSEAERLVEIVGGMKVYFVKMLGKALLYKFERVQYAEMCKLWEEGKGGWAGRGAGDCYGVEHLCRLIVSMPEYIARTDMDAQAVAKVKEEMTLLMQWMTRNHQRLFINELERPTAEYIESSRD